MSTSHDLSTLYETYRQKRDPAVAEIASKFFAPLLIEPPIGWETAENRVVFIGQETRGWNWSRESGTLNNYEWNHSDVYSLADFFSLDDGIPALMAGYRQFNFAAEQSLNYRSPFWRYFRKTESYLSQKGRTTSILFSNVIRCAADSESDGFNLWSAKEEDRRPYIQWQHGLLKAELRVLQPTLILFVCGPNYDEFLKEEFASVSFEAMNGFKEREVAKLRSADLPAPTYRTYHPAYLNRQDHLKFEPLRRALDEVEAKS